MADTEIKDDDLVKQLEAIQKGNIPGKKTAIQSLRMQQHQRDTERKKLNDMTPIQRRRFETFKDIKKRDEDNIKEDIRYLHSVLALCGLPYKRPKDDTQPYMKKYGNTSLLVSPGYLKEPQSSDMVQYGVPYGPKARLLLIHICSEALAQQSAKVQIEPNMTAFIRRLGFKRPTGGIKGEIKPFKEQLNRLAACRMAIGTYDNVNGKATTLKTDPIESFEVYFPASSEQYSLWSSEIHLNPQFYETLRNHALPIDIGALSAFTQSARQMDIIWWLSYRTRKLSKEYFLNWKLVQEQFGNPNTHPTTFRGKFVEDIEAVLSVYPKAPIRVTEKALILTPCDTENLFVPPVKKLR